MLRTRYFIYVEHAGGKSTARAWTLSGAFKELKRLNKKHNPYSFYIIKGTGKTIIQAYNSTDPAWLVLG